MAVIREDVVSIGFEVEQNPFTDLTSGINEIKAKLGILNETEGGLKDVGREAKLAGRELDGLANGIHAPPADSLTKPLKDTQKETKKTEVTFTGLLNTMKDTGRQKLTDGVNQLAAGVKKPLEGMKGLAKEAQGASRYMKKVGLPHALNVGLGKAAGKTGELLAGMKGAAGIGFNKAVSGLKNIATHAAGAAKSLGSKAWGGVKALSKGAAVGIAAAGTALSVGAVAAFNFGAAYETSLAKVSTIADTTAVSMADLSADVLKLSNATGEDASGLNEAVYQALSAGADTAGVVGLVNTAVKAAKGGYTDTTTAIDGLTSTLNAYGMATSDAEGLANQFLITQNKGKTTFGELAGSIGTVAPTANAAGVGVDQLLAGVASLTANGIGTSEAMTGIKAALSNVIKPSSEAAKVAKKLGLNFSTSALQSKGLAGFLDDVKTATGGNMDTMAQLFGSVEALNTVLTLTSDQGSQLMNDTLNEMAVNATALDDAYHTMADTAQNSVAKGINSFKNLGIGIYQANEGPVAELTGLFADAGNELFDAFDQGGMDGLSGQIGSTLSNVLVTLTGYLPQLIQGGSSIIRSLISGIMQNREQITSSVMQGLTNMAMGILQVAPDILALGGMLLMSLVQGLDAQLPNLIPVALSAIQNLCNGLIQNAPAIIQSGINIILQLINGLIAAAPTILTTGIQLVILLAKGLIGAIPQLIQAIPKLVGAIITTLMSVDWLKLGFDIVKGIGGGIVEGVKGLFSKGKDAGKEVGAGVAEGLNESTSRLTAAAGSTTADAVEGFKPDTVQLSDYGLQMPAAVASGIESGSALVEDSAAALGSTAFEAVNLAMSDTSEGTQPIFDGLTASFDGTMSDMNLSAEAQLGQMDTTFQTGFSSMVTEAGDFRGDFKGEIDQTDLYQSGVNIMQGLDNGLNSMRPSVIATAKGIASDVKNTVNGSLDIHSPSRVMEDSGEFTGLGLIKGLKNMTGRIINTARGIGDATAGNLSPMRSRYSPEASAMTENRTDNQMNTWNPVFNLTLNGASASDSNERKVKRWVREAMKEAIEGMGRTNPRIQEV